MLKHKRNAGLAFTLALLLSPMAFAQDGMTALAMHGTPKLGANFTHFPYTNPDAPKGGTLKLSSTGTFDSLNPFIVRGQPPLGLNTGYMSLLYEPLMARSWDEPFTLYGLLAESVDVPEDRSSITFHLNPIAKWSDGQAITADDVMFSFVTLRDKGRPNHRAYYKKVAHAEKLDDHSVRFIFKPSAGGTIDREMPLIMALMPVLPKHDWIGREFNQTTWKKPVGSGPYIVSTVDPGRSITYTRNANYWGSDVPSQRGLYNFYNVKIDYYRDDGVALQAFKADQYDLRRESNINTWITGYDFPAAYDGRVKLERLEHQRTEPITGFALNTRRAPFNDPVLRHAVISAFDATWINHNLFHGQYKHSASFFPNSELAAPAQPDQAELKILEPYRSQLPATIFAGNIERADMDSGEGSLRTTLKQASHELLVAGYTTQDNILYAPDHQPVTFEVLLSDPSEEKIALTWGRSLDRLGIHIKVHTIDSAQYQSRLAAFDYDVTSAKWFNSLSPGNEQSAFWSIESASQQGSRNYPGVKDPVIDALAAAIPAATSREQLVATTHALDRVLMAGDYIVPFYYTGADLVAWWTNHLDHPKYTALYGVILETWWTK